jgi:hypothetical protein
MKSIQHLAYLLLALVLGAIVAKEGAFIFVPLLWAVFFAFALYPISSWLERKRFPRGFAVGLSILLVSILAFGVFYLLLNQVFGLIREIPEIGENVKGKLTRYTEYEWAPNNEALDLRIRRPDFDFGWSSGMEWQVRVDAKRKVWTCEVRIPLTALDDKPPVAGTRWRANLYRIDRTHKAFLASNPVLSGSFHTPDRFGWLEFTE